MTNTVQVSSPDAVRDAVQHLLQGQYPELDFSLVSDAFDEFTAIFTGEAEGFEGCDTVYHDIQHTLDMSLAFARLLVGHDRQVGDETRLGPDRAAVGMIVALFHDAGYIRRSHENEKSGSEYTRNHVTRGAALIRDYLNRHGLATAGDVASQVVHFTGEEIKHDDIEVDDSKYITVGHLLGTADLIAQMSDRCYLEKCRDRLFPEFVLGGIATNGDNKNGKIIYESGIDLLRKTPGFFHETSRKKLDGLFNKSYRFLEVLFNGENPYMQAVEQNLNYLQVVIAHEMWLKLRREPPCFTSERSSLSDTQELAQLKLNGIDLGD
ncbi:MAG: HD domain-containing protein [Pseudomonadota bacterium]